MTVARAPARCGPMRLARWALRVSVCQVCVVCRDAWSFSSIGPCGVVLIGPWRLNSELFAHWHPLAFCFCGGSQSVLCDCVVETVCGIYETGGVYTSVV